MDATRFNPQIAAGRAAAEANLQALERGYRITLQTAARRASDRFSALSTDHLTADATDPKWSPPENDQLIDPEAMAADAQKRTKLARHATLKAVMAPVLADVGIAYDLTNPLVAGLVDKLGVRAADMGDAVRGDVAKAVLAAYQQGLSVVDAAKSIQDAVEGIAPTRAAMLARTDLVGLANGASVAAAQLVAGSDGDAGRLGFKQWLATEDERTRETHSAADGQIVPLEQTFTVGDDQLAYPGDPDGSDEEVCNCRCSVVYLDASEAAGDVTAAMQAPTGDVTSQGLMDEPPDDTTAAVTVTVDGDEMPDMAMAEVRWQAVLCVEGVQTEDGRMLETGSITWRDLPLSLGAMFETPHSYDASAEICGRIDAIWRNGNQIMGSGVFGMDEVGCRAAEMVANLSLRGISVDLGILAYELREADPPVATDETDDTPDESADVADVITEIDNLVFVVTDGVIGAATVCPFQAIAGATIAVVADAGTDEARFVQNSCFVLSTAPVQPLVDDAVDELDPRLVASLAKLEQVARPDRFREYQLGMETGIYTLNDCMRAEGRPPVEGGDERSLPMPAATLATLTDRLVAMSATHDALVAALDRAAAHEEQTQTLVATIDALTGKVAAGEKVDAAMIETLRAMSVRKPLDVIRDASGRAVSYEPRETV